jgi:hypothetical protein
VDQTESAVGERYLRHFPNYKVSIHGVRLTCGFRGVSGGVGGVG